MDKQSLWDKTYVSLSVPVGGSVRSTVDCTIARRDDGSLYSSLKTYVQSESGSASTTIGNLTVEELRRIATNLLEQALYLENLAGGAA